MNNQVGFGVTLKHGTSVRRFMLSSNTPPLKSLDTILEEFGAVGPTYKNAEDFFAFCQAQLKNNGFDIVRE